jgi:hypothetical protein
MRRCVSRELGNLSKRPSFCDEDTFRLGNFVKRAVFDKQENLFERLSSTSTSTGTNAGCRVVQDWY